MLGWMQEGDETGPEPLDASWGIAVASGHMDEWISGHNFYHLDVPYESAQSDGRAVSPSSLFSGYCTSLRSRSRQ